MNNNNNRMNIPTHNVPIGQNFVNGMMQPPMPINTIPPMPGQKIPSMMMPPPAQGFYPPNFGNPIPPMNMQPGNIPIGGGLGPKPTLNPQQQEREKI